MDTGFSLLVSGYVDEVDDGIQVVRGYVDEVEHGIQVVRGYIDKVDDGIQVVRGYTLMRLMMVSKLTSGLANSYARVRYI